METSYIGKRIFLPVLFVPVLILLDQLTKKWAVSSLRGHDDIILIRGVLQLRYIENRGAAFGILKDSRLFFIILTVLFAVVITVFYVSYYKRQHASMALVLLYSYLTAGAIGNFIDRLLHGFVVDFIYFSLIDFPVFNVADIYITCSCVFVIIYVFLSEKKHGHSV